MHIVAATRWSKAGRQIVHHIIVEARATGLDTLNLETGIRPCLHPVDAPDEVAGYVNCAPCKGDHADENNLSKTRALSCWPLVPLITGRSGPTLL